MSLRYPILFYKVVCFSLGGNRGMPIDLIACAKLACAGAPRSENGHDQEETADEVWHTGEHKTVRVPRGYDQKRSADEG